MEQWLGGRSYLATYETVTVMSLLKARSLKEIQLKIAGTAVYGGKYENSRNNYKLGHIFRGSIIQRVYRDPPDKQGRLVEPRRFLRNRHTPTQQS